MIVSHLNIDAIRSKAWTAQEEESALITHLDARAQMLERPETDDQDHGIFEVVRRLLFGRDARGSELARACSVKTVPLFRSAVEASGLDLDAAIAMPRITNDLRIDDDEGRQIYATWLDSLGRNHLRAALGGGVHVTDKGDILVPELPDTIIHALPGRRLVEIVDHPLLDRDAVIREVGNKRLWRQTVMRALKV